MDDLHGQFIHVDAYAKVAPKAAQQYQDRIAAAKGRRAERVWNISQIIGEVMRDPGDHRHVPNPGEPTFLIGDEALLRGLPDEIERNTER